MAKRRSFKPEFKARVVLQVLTGTKTAVRVYRERQLDEQLLTSWKKQLLARADSLPAISRSNFYYQPAEADESEMREAVNQLAAQFQTYGSRRLATQLRRAPYLLLALRGKYTLQVSRLDL
jgi:putative transposase